MFSDSVSACSGEGRRFFGMTETNLICAQGGILDLSPTAHIAPLVRRSYKSVRKAAPPNVPRLHGETRLLAAAKV